MATSFSTVFFVQRDGKMFSQLVGPGSVIKVADLENAKPEKSSYWVLNAMQKSQMYPLMEHLGITSEGNPGSKENCIKKIIAKWPLPPPEISDEENLVPEISDEENLVPEINEFVDKAFESDSASEKSDDEEWRMRHGNIHKFAIFLSKSPDDILNEAITKFQKVFRGWLVRRVVRELKVEGKLVSSGPYHDYHHMRYVAFGQIGGGKRARGADESTFEIRESDPQIIKDMLASFSTPWGRDKWAEMALSPQLPQEVLDAMISVQGGGGAEQRVHRLLMCLPQFKQLEDRQS